MPVNYSITIKSNNENLKLGYHTDSNDHGLYVHNLKNNTTRYYPNLRQVSPFLPQIKNTTINGIGSVMVNQQLIATITPDFKWIGGQDQPEVSDAGAAVSSSGEPSRSPAVTSVVSAGSQVESFSIGNGASRKTISIPLDDADNLCNGDIKHSEITLVGPGRVTFMKPIVYSKIILQRPGSLVFECTIDNYSTITAPEGSTLIFKEIPGNEEQQTFLRKLSQSTSAQVSIINSAGQTEPYFPLRHGAHRNGDARQPMLVRLQDENTCHGKIERSEITLIGSGTVNLEQAIERSIIILKDTGMLICHDKVEWSEITLIESGTVTFMKPIERTKIVLQAPGSLVFRGNVARTNIVLQKPGNLLFEGAVDDYGTMTVPEGSTLTFKEISGNEEQQAFLRKLSQKTPAQLFIINSAGQTEPYFPLRHGAHRNGDSRQPMLVRLQANNTCDGEIKWSEITLMESGTVIFLQSIERSKIVLQAPGNLTFESTVAWSEIKLIESGTLIFMKPIERLKIVLQAPGNLTFESTVDKYSKIIAPAGSVITFNQAPSSDLLADLSRQEGVRLIVAGTEYTAPPAPPARTASSTQVMFNRLSVNSSSQLGLGQATAVSASRVASVPPAQSLVGKGFFLEFKTNASGFTCNFNGHAYRFPLGERTVLRVFGQEGNVETMAQILVTESTPPDIYIKTGAGVKVSALNNCVESISFNSFCIDARGSHDLKIFENSCFEAMGSINIGGTLLDDSIFDATTSPSEELSTKEETQPKFS